MLLYYIKVLSKYLLSALLGTREIVWNRAQSEAYTLIMRVEEVVSNYINKPVNRERSSDKRYEEKLNGDGFESL